MNEKILFDIVLALLLVFLIVSTFVDYYKITHPCITTINAKVLCTKIDKRCVIEYTNNKNVIKKVTGTATFDYDGHILTYSNNEFIDNCVPGTYYHADIDTAKYIHDKSPYFMITNVYPETDAITNNTNKED